MSSKLFKLISTFDQLLIMVSILIYVIFRKNCQKWNKSLTKHFWNQCLARVGSWFPLKFKSRSDSGLVRKFENFRNFFVQCSSEIAEFSWRGAENYSPPLIFFALGEFSFESFEPAPHFNILFAPHTDF